MNVKDQRLAIVRQTVIADVKKELSVNLIADAKTVTARSLLISLSLKRKTVIAVKINAPKMIDRGVFLFDSCVAPKELVEVTFPSDFV